MFPALIIPSRETGKMDRDVRRELAELVADHLLGDLEVVVFLAVVHLEPEADETRQDGGGAGLRADRLDFFAWEVAYDGEAVGWVGG